MSQTLATCKHDKRAAKSKVILIFIFNESANN